VLSLEGSSHSEEHCRRQPGKASEGAALMAQLNGMLQFLVIEHPPLGAAPATSIHQGSTAASAIAGQQL